MTSNQLGLNTHRRKVNREMFVVNQADPIPRVQAIHHNDIEDWMHQYCDIFATRYLADNHLIKLLSSKLEEAEESSTYWYDELKKLEKKNATRLKKNS